MGQLGAAGDNAAMVSFFALLQKNALNSLRWATRDDLRLATRPVSNGPTAVGGGNASSVI